MTTTDDPTREASPPFEARYAGVPTPVGLLLYDTERESAWIETDSTVSLDEVR